MDFYSAQICLNGHARNCYSEFKEKFCSICGAETIQQCPNCHEVIRGKQKIKGVVDFTEYKVPNYCFNCGKPYPWTQSKLDAMKELIDFDEQLSQDEKAYMTNNVQELTVDTPKASAVATKFSVFLRKAGKITVSAIRDILVDIASETAKKIIFPE